MNPVEEVIRKINEECHAHYTPQRATTRPPKLGYTDQEFAGIAAMSFSRFNLFKAGAYEVVPSTMVRLVDEHLGEGSGAKFEADYMAFRASLSDEVKAELERKLWPAGRGYGMCP